MQASPTAEHELKSWHTPSPWQVKPLQQSDVMVQVASLASRQVDGISQAQGAGGGDVGDGGGGVGDVLPLRRRESMRVASEVSLRPRRMTYPSSLALLSKWRLEQLHSSSDAQASPALAAAIEHTPGWPLGGSGREMSTATPLPSVDPCANLMGLPANAYDESSERLIASRQEEVAGTEEKVKGNVSPSITISSTPATESL